MAYNANLDQFLMFYSQADAGNGLTRGLDNDLARRTYVPTKLDNDLNGHPCQHVSAATNPDW